MAADAAGYTFDTAFASVLAKESWALFGVGTLTFLLRIYTKVFFMKGFNRDDYVQILAFGLYIGLLVTLNFIAQSGGSNLYEPGDEVHFTEEVIRDRVYNSKIVVVSEQFMLCCIYALKGSVILFYLRLTKGLARQKMIQYVAGSVLVAFVATQICFFTACQPFRGYWAVPPPSAECTTLRIYGIVQGVLNILTDLFMLGATVPVIYRLHVPLKQKLLLGGLFSLGVVVMLMAILAKVYNNSSYYSAGYMLWYIREASTATYVSNLPHIWPLIRHVFPCLRGASAAYNSTSGRYGPRSGVVTTTKGTGRHKADDEIMLNKVDLEANKIFTTVEVRQEDERVAPGAQSDISIESSEQKQYR